MDLQKTVRVNAANILDKPLTPKNLARIAQKPDSEIDSSDIPELTESQLAEFTSYRRPEPGRVIHKQA